jgi:hypothetical protein
LESVTLKSGTAEMLLWWQVIATALQPHQVCKDNTGVGSCSSVHQAATVEPGVEALGSFSRSTRTAAMEGQQELQGAQEGCSPPSPGLADRLQQWPHLLSASFIAVDFPSLALQLLCDFQVS